MSSLFLSFHRYSISLSKYRRKLIHYVITENYLKLLKGNECFRHFETIPRTCVDGEEEKATDKNRGLDWRDVVTEAEQLVGYPTPYLGLRLLLEDDVAKTALHLRKLICSNHPLLKSTKNVLFGSKYSLQSLGLMMMLTSKAAGVNAKCSTEEGRTSGILHSQRILSEIVEMKRNVHVLSNALSVHKNKDKYNDVQKFLCENNLLSAGFSGTLLENLKGLNNSEIFKLVDRGFEDLVKSENLGPRNKHNEPLPSKPKGVKEIDFWKEGDNLKNIDLENMETFLGRGKDEWIYRTMLSSGSILGKACQCAMMLAQKDDLEMDAYILGSHLAILWQLYLDLKDFYIHPHSFSYVGAPVTIALWEYPTIYSIFIESQLQKTEVEHRQVYYAVRSTRAMDYITYLLENEIAVILECSDKFPIEDARFALQKMAVTLYKEALEYIE